MGALCRIGVALDSDLLEQFDSLIGKLQWANRSEAFRDLIRDRLVADKLSSGKAMVMGTVTLIYDHNASGVTEKLAEIQHEHHDLVVSTSHAHLAHDSCLEVMIVRGEARVVEKFAGRMIGLKGVLHGRLVMSVAEQPSKRKRPRKSPRKRQQKHS
jgi:CopG family nickel-responsive transcriptional regulator